MALVRLPFLARALVRCLVNPESVFILRQTRWWRGPQFPNASSTIPFKQEGLLIVGTVFVLSAALACRAKPGATVSVPIKVGRRRFGISPLTTGLVCLIRCLRSCRAIRQPRAGAQRGPSRRPLSLANKDRRGCETTARNTVRRTLSRARHGARQPEFPWLGTAPDPVRAPEPETTAKTSKPAPEMSPLRLKEQAARTS